MDDPQIHGTIEQLVAEEQGSLAARVGRRCERCRPAATRGAEGLARPVLGPASQRRALREAGLDPPPAKARPTDVVEALRAAEARTPIHPGRCLVRTAPGWARTARGGRSGAPILAAVRRPAPIEESVGLRQRAAAFRGLARSGIRSRRSASCADSRGDRIRTCDLRFWRPSGIRRCRGSPARCASLYASPLQRRVGAGVASANDPGGRCPYRSGVVVIDAWPRNSVSAFRLTPAAIIVDAAVWRASCSPIRSSPAFFQARSARSTVAS